MGDYNKSIEELLKDFTELQISEIVKQVNVNTGAPTGTVGSNFPNPENYEHGETSNPFRKYNSARRRTQTKKAYSTKRRRSAINEEFKPRNPIM